ncbi:hypothetical protein MSG28_001979 [Choristoneura fumiferana]|uniref:Uncharacterized protein n=1 Tax=Choristoneura fumiferana TaxID=7141 RepID=A0ACC0JTL7_CHOFU|nr:hypothetical protein MSG28_001979 [Choristoneura fumiferana]
MKGGLCVIYTSLLTILVLSSCALFILVVSEALLETEGSVDLSGLHNVSQKRSAASDEDQLPDKLAPPEPEDKKEDQENLEMIFDATLSLNSTIIVDVISSASYSLRLNQGQDCSSR